MGLAWEDPILDPLVVQHLENRLSVYNVKSLNQIFFTSMAVTESAPILAAIIAKSPVPVPMSKTWTS